MNITINPKLLRDIIQVVKMNKGPMLSSDLKEALREHDVMTPGIAQKYLKAMVICEKPKLVAMKIKGKLYYSIPKPTSKSGN